MATPASGSLATRFSDCVIPQMISAGCFGQPCKFINCYNDPERKGKDQFASTVQFFELTVQEKDILHTINVIVKFQPEIEIIAVSMGGRLQFHNEVLMYSEILPLIEKDGIIEEIFSKYYHGSANPKMDFDNDFIVLEDLSKKNYKLTDEQIFLDYDHCVLALREIGRFHALSYAAKKNKNAEFKAAVSKIREKWDNSRLTRFKYMFLFCGQRGIQPLINKQEHADLLTEFVKNYNDPVKFYSSLVDPLENEAVLCHGDFCRNNMLFAYNNVGKPTSVKFFDLQTPRYSSPVIDLSFFLLMNTSKYTREKYWDEFLSVYTQSVQSVVPDISVPELDFRRVGIYGYLHCSFFLPIMMAGDDKIPLPEFLKLSPSEQGTAMSQVGGEKETDLLVDIVQFLLSKGYIRGKYF